MVKNILMGKNTVGRTVRSKNQIEIAAEFLLSAVGPGAPDLANEELRRAFRSGDFDQTRYWRAVKDRSIEWLVDEGLLEANTRGDGDNVIYAAFGRARARHAEAEPGPAAGIGTGLDSA